MCCWWVGLGRLPYAWLLPSVRHQYRCTRLSFVACGGHSRWPGTPGLQGRTTEGCPCISHTRTRPSLAIITLPLFWYMSITVQHQIATQHPCRRSRVGAAAAPDPFICPLPSRRPCTLPPLHAQPILSHPKIPTAKTFLPDYLHPTGAAGVCERRPRRGHPAAHGAGHQALEGALRGAGPQLPAPRRDAAAHLHAHRVGGRLPRARHRTAVHGTALLYAQSRTG